MSRFINYINEDEIDIHEINSLIQKDCKYYLNIIKNKYVFNRGMFVEKFGKRKVRQDRIPQGTAESTFKIFNKWLESNGHTRRDKAVIARNEANDNANDFGPLYYIFPIGKFKYTWIKAKDVNIADGKTGWGGSKSLDLFFEDSFDETRYIFENYFTTNKGIEEAWKNQYEIWFDCKEYHFFSKAHFKWLDKELYHIY